MVKVGQADEPSLGRASGWARRPGDFSLVVMRDPKTGARIMSEMRWGLPQAPGHGRQLYMRAEDLVRRGQAEPSRHRRLIIPMDGYVQRASRGEDRRRPFSISLLEDAPMAVAGVWTEDEDGPAFAVLTYRANLAISPLHDRMPAVLAPDAWPSWLSDEPLTGPELATLIQSASPALFRVELMGAASAGRADKPEQLKLLGLDPADIREAVARPRRRRAAASKIAKVQRRAVG